jgi:diguanylate cyclase (GGDEF)-like protein/PAS domain S-box-containing protein
MELLVLLSFLEGEVPVKIVWTRMGTNLRRLFEPPDLGSGDLNRRARLLHSILIFLIAFTIVLGFIYWLLLPQNWLVRGLILIAILVEFASFFTLRGGRLRFAGAGLVYLLWVVLMLTILFMDGIGGPSILGQVLLIFLGGLLIGSRFAAVLTILTVLGNYLALLLDLSGNLMLSNLQLTLPGMWVVQSAYLLLAFGVMLALARSIRESLEAAQSNEEGLRDRVAELRQAQTQLQMSEQTLRSREDILVALRAAAEKLFRSPNFDDAVQEVIGDLGRAADIDRIYICENHLDSNGEFFVSQRFAWSYKDVDSQINNPELDAFYFEKRGFTRWVETLSRNVILKGHVRDFPESERGFLSSLGTISTLVVPIFIGPRWWGFMGFDETKHKRTWSPSEEDALRGAGGILGGAIERMHAERALSTSESRYLGILQDQFDLIGRYKPNGRLIFANSAYARYFGMNPDQVSEMKIWTQVPPDGVERLKAKIASITPSQPVSVTQSINTRFDGEQRWIEWTDRGTFDDAGKLVEIQAVGRDIHEEVRLRKQLEESLLQMETQAMSDGLTGLLNRRAIMEHAEAEWQRAQREKKPLSLVVMDVDRLKDINDTFGHLIGDQALVKLAELMKNGMRRYDWVGRWGGDEFLLILPGSGMQESHDVAERLRQRFKQSKIKLNGGQDIELHVSLGVASQPSIEKGGDTLQTLIARADQALYKAKQSGRDQVGI